ncbi:MAG: hypothetical protein VX446_07375 [Bacteroidota bacterium]|nr:hypothetical protein [Bacteroidota bacterium]
MIAVGFETPTTTTTDIDGHARFDARSKLAAACGCASYARSVEASVSVAAGANPARYRSLVATALYNLDVNGDAIKRSHAPWDVPFLKQAVMGRGTRVAQDAADTRQRVLDFKAMMDSTKTRFADAVTADGLAATERCRACRSDRVFYYSRQSRSGDEAATAHFQCLKCGYSWKKN